MLKSKAPFYSFLQEKKHPFYLCRTRPSISKVTLDNHSHVIKFKISNQLWISEGWLVFEVVTCLDNRRCHYYCNQNKQEKELCKVYNDP